MKGFGSGLRIARRRLGKRTQAWRSAQRRPGDQLKFCREAKTWMQKALPVFRQREAQGKLAAGEVGTPETLAQKIKNCDRTLGRLSGLDSQRH